MKVTRALRTRFRRECERLAKLWGIASSTRRQYLAVQEGEGVVASCSFDSSQRALFLNLCPTCPDGAITDEKPNTIENLARHEMIHGILQPLSSFAYMRHVSETEIDTAEHEVLQRLDALLPK